MAISFYVNIDKFLFTIYNILKIKYIRILCEKYFFLKKITP
ncbi:hypothetical protein CAPGI0001_1041 [Capnocytophaga gingivalis ATCC 33624]|nr:hypothetical protein CAPGI0001_1041 [Capnocytophaga gingivalis ATCC 33624]